MSSAAGRSRAAPIDRGIRDTGERRTVYDSRHAAWRPASSKWMECDAPYLMRRRGARNRGPTGVQVQPFQIEEIVSKIGTEVLSHNAARRERRGPAGSSFECIERSRRGPTTDGASLAVIVVVAASVSTSVTS